MAVTKDESADSIKELFGKALSYNNIFAEIVAKSQSEVIEQPLDIPGMIFESEQISPSKLPIVVKLPTTQLRNIPRHICPWYLEIEWEVISTKDEDDIVIPDLDVINSEEDMLARKLKKCCDAFSKEADSKLKESATIMLAMGKLYLERAVSCGALVNILVLVKNAGNAQIIADRYNRASNMQYDPEPYINDVSRQLAEEAGTRLPEGGVKKFGSTLQRIIENYCQQIKQKTISGNPNTTSPTYYLTQLAAHFKMEQKLSFLKAAGLITAGKIRFIEMHDHARRKFSEDLFISVFCEMLTSAGLKESSEIKISNFIPKIFLTPIVKRSVMEKDLEDIVRVLDTDSDVVQHEKETVKISQIRKLYERNAADFIDFMCEIAEKCRQILGKPPCKFAIVGLGSLARNEVTLYSDFEHAIVLENEAENCEMWPFVLEYFRWYTVTFHAIVIALGETVLPGLDIRGLREHNTEKCWFYDAFTPNGISFDGMMPHACKIPLGRTGKTKSKDHTVELIQTSKKMAQFLTRDEDIKNGYFLKEVMSQTCFVYGDVEVYESFLEECRNISSREIPDNLATRVAKYILLNPLGTVTGFHNSFHGKEESNKRLTYRPFTMHLGYFAQLCKIECKASFDILDEMKRTEIIDAESYHTLASALAVSMEVNLKVYHKAGNQSKTFLPYYLANLVGERSWIDCQVVLDILRDNVKFILPVRCTRIGLPLKRSAYWKILTCYNLPSLGWFGRAARQALKYVLDMLEEYEGGTMCARYARDILAELFGCLRHCFLRMYMQRFAGTPDSDMLVFRRTLPEGEFHELYPCEWACLKVLQLGGSELQAKELQSSACQSLCVIRFNQMKYKEGLGYFERWEKMTDGHERDQVDMWMYEMFMRMEVMGNETVLDYIKQKLLENILPERRLVLEIIRCQIWLSAGYFAKAKKELSRISMDTKETFSREMTEYSTVYILKIIREIQRNNNFENHVGTSNVLLKAATSKNAIKLTSDVSQTEEKLAMQEHVRATINQQGRTQFLKLTERESAILLLSKITNFLPICFTHDETLGMTRTIFFKFVKGSDRPLWIIAPATALMFLFESANEKDIETAFQTFREAPRAVRAYRALQPFFYGFIKSLPIGHERGVLHKHDNVLSALFQSRVIHKMYDSALNAFVNLSFRESLNLVWKLCQSPGISKKVKKASLELFITAAVTVLVQRKRQNTCSYFSKMKEVSTKQFQWVSAAEAQRTKEFSKRNIERSKLLIFHDLPLADVYNFAMNGNDMHPGRMCYFYWRILHYPTESKIVKKAALLALLDVIATHNPLSNNFILFWPQCHHFCL